MRTKKRKPHIALILTVSLVWLILSADAAASDWFVRPAGGSYGTEDGSSYEDAWDGLSNVVWGPGGVEAGDNLYVCGFHLRTRTGGSAWEVFTPGASGTDENSRIIIRGDYPGDPGIIWGAGIMAHEPWVDEGNNTWSIKFEANHYRGWFFEDVTASSWTVLDEKSSLAEVQATPGSYYASSYNAGSKFYVHTSDNGDPTDRIAANRLGYNVKVNNNHYITWKNLEFYSIYRWINYTSAPYGFVTYMRWENTTIWYGEFVHFLFRNRNHHIEFINCDVAWATNGIGSGAYPYDSPDPPYNLTIRECKIHDIGVTYGDTDSHGTFAQVSHDVLIENNEIYNTGSGFTAYVPANAPITNYTVRWNWVHDTHTNFGANDRGIEFSTGGNGAEYTTGNKIYGNIVGPGVDGIGYKYTWEDLGEFYNNISYECGTSFYIAHHLQRVRVKLRNLISLNPATYHILFRSNGNEGDYIIDSDYNLFWPISGDQFYFWEYATASGGAKTFTEWQALSKTGCTFDPHSIVADPLFVDPENGNFHLWFDSPAIDAGIDVGLTQDFEGNPIPQGLAPDIGAYEYGQGLVLSLSSTSGGSVTNPGEGSFPYEDGTVVSIEATADDNYYFVNWTGTAVDAGKVANPSAASTTVTVDAYYTIQATFATDLHALTISSTSGGSVTNPGEGPFLYDDGTGVSIQATADDNYHFVNWTGTAVDAGQVADPGSASTTVTVNADYTLQANFSIDQHNLTISSTSGGTVTTPGEGTYPYDHGTAASVIAAPTTNYHFVNWTGTAVDAGKVANPNAASTTVTADADYTIQANFAIDQHTLTISSTSGGTVTTPGEGTYAYDHGTAASVVAALEASYYFVNWTGTAVNAGKVANPNAASTTVTVDADYTIRANFGESDGIAPTVTNCSPAASDIQVPLNNIIILHVTDADIGVKASSVIITLDGDTIYTGDTPEYSSATGICRRIGTIADYTYAYQSSQTFDFDESKTVTVNATDLGGIAMTEESYSFTTEMRSFGQNKQVSSGLDNLNSGGPATVCDTDGNIWAVWHAGPAGSRNIYVAKLAAGADAFGTSVQIRSNNSDQANPAVALGTDDKLCVVWQDNREGDWDIYGSTSTGGSTWSVEQRLVDSNDNYNQTNPALAVDSQSPNRAHVVWQEGGAGDRNIYIATSSNNFVTNTVTQITSNTSDQTDPAIAVDSSYTVYVLWTDARNPTNGNDIYGASGSGWTNVPIVTKAADQSSPAFAVESTGSILHMLWVDKTPGDSDIYYASSDGLPGSPLTGSSIIDDSSGADQLDPTIAVTGSTDNNLKVFACWQDWRNTDTDLYFAELSSGSGTNVFVDEGGSNAYQGEPVIGIDEYSHPYLIWADNRSTNTDIYYAGSTFVEPVALASELVSASASSSTTVGTDPQAITTVDDVSIVVPAGACSYDVIITITKIANLPAFAAPCLGGYDFGPSGIQFNQPVTITIPYVFSGSDGSAKPYWFNSLTGILSQQGITDIQDIPVSSSLHALSFKTTHFTAFYLFAGGGAAAIFGGGGGGGGCSVSASGEGNIVEYILPYIGLAVVMVMLKMRDARYRKGT